jgi:hypothetical protein
VRIDSRQRTPLDIDGENDNLNDNLHDNFQDQVVVAAWNENKKLSVPPPPAWDDITTPNISTTAWLLSESAAHRVLRHDLEGVLSRHFVEKYYDLLLLPNCHPEFHHGWIHEMGDLMLQHKSLQYSVLACAASHIHFIDASSPMQELALTYYSQAIRGLSEILAMSSASQPIENNNGLLMSVMLLYLHGVRSIPSPLPCFV